ncbi:MAG: cation:proton antiporter [Gammaproteobacteria bacterium]|nr:cation:proton antiporter [Gammaproteobacteria bacterium]NND39020.1 potassium transporter Kef [Pseudomonadales bacterium]NNL11390.1 potassium transporter Kef [Pseudomonadales bacterium]NNM10483.1 potassium transporter Kef [Pseudomonadales bacterium]
MTYLWVSIAFIFGFLVRQIGLPPLVGYLVAGFALNAAGVAPDPSLQLLGDLGIGLLLFSIGLKLDLKRLARLEVFGTTFSHMATIVLLTTLNCFLLGSFGMVYFAGIDLAAALLIGFAVSFSSTIIAVKVLEENGEMSTRHGKLAIAILVVQDIAAVAFVTIASGAEFSWALSGLLLLPLLLPLLSFVLSRSGHGELLPLAGICLALLGGQFFEWMGLKAHLGALVFGLLLSKHSKAAELSKSMLNLKDLFLIGFFLSIGFVALPTLPMTFAALIMAIALPFKAMFFHLWFVLFRLRARTAFLASLSLANYSEFGLIVAAISVKEGLMDADWLVIMALAVSFSFVFSGALNARSDMLYERWSTLLRRYQRQPPLPLDEPDSVGNATVLVVGLGRVGNGAYETLYRDFGSAVCGVDVDRSRVDKLRNSGRAAIVGDAEDPEFWARMDVNSLHLVMFCMPNFKDTLHAVNRLAKQGYKGSTAAIARFEDERQALIDGGVDQAYNLYAEAGAGFAEQSVGLLAK